MAEIFKSVDTDNRAKLDRTGFIQYFKLLSVKIGQSDFKTAARVSQECLDNVWFELDPEGTGYISWHAVKPFIARLVAHEAELEEERRIAAEERAVRLAEYNRVKAERERRRREDEAKAAEEAENQENE